jgi:hypothetical protein
MDVGVSVVKPAATRALWGGGVGELTKCAWRIRDQRTWKRFSLSQTPLLMHNLSNPCVLFQSYIRAVGAPFLAAFCKHTFDFVTKLKVLGCLQGCDVMHTGWNLPTFPRLCETLTFCYQTAGHDAVEGSILRNRYRMNLRSGVRGVYRNNIGRARFPEHCCFYYRSRSLT